MLVIIIINPNVAASALYFDLLRQGKEERTARQYKTIVSNYLYETGLLNKFETKNVKKSLSIYLDNLRARGYRDKTIQFRFSAINLFYDLLEDSGEIDRNPVPLFRNRYLIRYKPQEPPKYQNWNPDNIQLMIDAAGRAKNKELWQAIIASYASSGIRRGELLPLNIGDISFENRIFHLHDHKKRSNRDVCFSDWALNYILDYLELRME